MGITQNTTCPNENALVGLIEGTLSSERLAHIEGHIDCCAPCASVMHELAELIAPPTHSEQDDKRHGSTGPVIGRYEVLEEIGSGGMGVVYAAYDPHLRRKIALKLLRPDIGHLTDMAAARARLLREARLLATLSHPNVVAVYDVGTMGEDIFIAVELVEGKSLAEWMDAGRPSWREVAEIYVQAARGLLAAHVAGLIHRDIKPANLLLGTDGGVRVTDFGLATATAATDAPGEGHAARQDTSLLTQSGAVVGTPAYMAPEQYAGRGTDERSDQFSFCVSLAEAFIGQRPTAGATADDLIEMATAHDRKPPPLPLLEVVARGLCARAADRHDDMAAVASALEHVLNGEVERLLTANDAGEEDRGSTVRPPQRAGATPSSLGWIVAVLLSGALVYAFMQNRTPAVAADGATDATAMPVPTPTARDETVVVADPSVALTANTSAFVEPTLTSPDGARPGTVIAMPATGAATLPPGAPNADKAFPDAARSKYDGDGHACLARLAEGARLDPQRATSGSYQRLRAHCRMLTGDCAGGRRLLRAMMVPGRSGAALETAIDAESLPSCRKRATTKLTSKKGRAMLAAVQALYTEAQTAKEAGNPQRCRAVGAKIDAYVASHRVAGEPTFKNTAFAASTLVTQCLAEQLDCTAARANFVKKYQTLHPGLMSPDEYSKNLKPMFESTFPQCKGK